MSEDLKEIWKTISILNHKPSHSIYFILTILGSISYYQIIVNAFNDGANKDLVHIFFDTITILCVIIATFIHVILIYKSLIDCEDDKEFIDRYSNWVGQKLEIGIRYVSFIILSIISGKLIFERIYDVDLALIIAIANSCIFLLFLIWSIFAYRRCDIKLVELRNYLVSDLLAFCHWVLITSLLYSKNESLKVPIMFLALFYFIWVVLFRLTKEPSASILILSIVGIGGVTLFKVTI